MYDSRHVIFSLSSLSILLSLFTISTITYMIGVRVTQKSFLFSSFHQLIFDVLIFIFVYHGYEFYRTQKSPYLLTSDNQLNGKERKNNKLFIFIYRFLYAFIIECEWIIKNERDSNLTFVPKKSVFWKLYKLWIVDEDTKKYLDYSIIVGIRSVYKPSQLSTSILNIRSWELRCNLVEKVAMTIDDCSIF